MLCASLLLISALVSASTSTQSSQSQHFEVIFVDYDETYDVAYIADDTGPFVMGYKNPALWDQSNFQMSSNGCIHNCTMLMTNRDENPINYQVTNTGEWALCSGTSGCTNRVVFSVVPHCRFLGNQHVLGFEASLPNGTLLNFYTYGHPSNDAHYNIYVTTQTSIKNAVFFSNFITTLHCNMDNPPT